MMVAGWAAPTSSSGSRTMGRKTLTAIFSPSRSKRESSKPISWKPTVSHAVMLVLGKRKYIRCVEEIYHVVTPDFTLRLLVPGPYLGVVYQIKNRKTRQSTRWSSLSGYADSAAAFFLAEALTLGSTTSSTLSFSSINEGKMPPSFGSPTLLRSEEHVPTWLNEEYQPAERPRSTDPLISKKGGR